MLNFHLFGNKGSRAQSATDECHELAPLHSITSSARASSEGGTSRQSALAGLIADWSGLVDLVDGNDGKRAGPTRIVHAGHGIDGLTDLCDGKTVAWRDHAGST